MSGWQLVKLSQVPSCWKLGSFSSSGMRKVMNCEGWKRKSPVLSSPPALLDPNLLFCCNGWNHMCGILHFSLSRLCREGGVCFIAEPVRILFSRRLEFDWTPSYFVAAKIQKTKRLSSGQIPVINKNQDFKVFTEEIWINEELWGETLKPRKNPASGCWYFHFTLLVKRCRNLSLFLLQTNIWLCSGREISYGCVAFHSLRVQTRCIKLQERESSFLNQIFGIWGGC